MPPSFLLAALALPGKDTAMDMLDGETEIRDYALERVIMLSDGVFAIAMTLLAFDLRPPEHWDHTMAGLLDGMAGPFQAFFWSFFAIGSFWLAHRRMFGVYRRADGFISVLNLVLLGEIVLIPGATRILTEMNASDASLRLYLGLFLLIGLTNATSWTYVAFFTELMRPPKRGPFAKLVVAAIYAFVPVGMTALGLTSNHPAKHWLPLLMPLVLICAHGGRRLADRLDRRLGAVALPAPVATGQLDG
jgi:uncharacterized membrane protein